jgi:hypothetical protein
MNKLFIALDADNAGGKVGQAVLMDDVEALHSVSKHIGLGLQAAISWVTQRGGTVISSGGDEMTAMLDPRHREEIEDLRQKFTDASGGITVTVGHGLTLSQAGKSLLAGKLSGKNQSMAYSHEVEDALHAAHNHQDGTEEENKINEHYLDHVMGDSDDEIEGDDHWRSESDGIGEFDGDSMQDYRDEGPTHTEMPPEIDADDENEWSPGFESPTTEDSFDESESEKSAEHSTQSHVDEILGEDEQSEDSEDEDVGGDHSGSNEDGAIEIPESDKFVDANEEEQNTETAEKSPEPEMQAPEAQESPDISDPGAVGGDAENQGAPEDGGPSEEFYALQEMLESSATPDELRQKIAQILEQFKQNKSVIDEMKTAAPDAYKSVIAMLQTMVAMAKELGAQEGGQSDSGGQSLPKA